MPFELGTFGHLLCYNTLHHMHYYPKVFAEFFRVLKGAGEASSWNRERVTVPRRNGRVCRSAEKARSSWIERDVMLEKIDHIARTAGFAAGLCIVAMPHSLALQAYSMEDWSRFRDGDALERLRLTDQLASLNYWERVIFYVDKPE